MIPHLVQMRQKYPTDKVVMIGLSDETQAKVQPFVKANGMNYAVGWGSKSNRDYGVHGIPHAFIIGPDGTIKWEGNPSNPQFESTIDSLAGTVAGKKGTPAPVPEAVNPGNKALGDLIAAAVKTESIPQDLEIHYTRTDPAKKSERKVSIHKDLQIEVVVEDSGDTKKAKIEEKELQELVKAIAETEFCTKEYKEPPKPNVTISVVVGQEGRDLQFDSSKGYGNYGRVNKLLEDLYT